ncbi:hypothetical protein CAI16_03165 [Virgibacillus dokdonensis]|uniref:Uncharacterized protein n=1 Tax=Virgibacillus dokdonensis TaxID=302167 RepID=A0A3E0WYH5_9BACI|nr:hypothetical protein [Virgibacillus dokdonensis]RFA37086.1 hypothetical protein CAI16_03165 [Virgibacillus dokdonensis]
MSERKKQVIHVKDLVIKADNVFIEPQRPPRPPHRRDPFSSRRRPFDENEKEDHEKEDSYDREDDEHREDERRSPFSWL